MWKCFIFLAVGTMGFCASPKEALDRLVEGNTRFSRGEPQKTYEMTQRRKETALKQNPFAVIVACSDSRVSPEILFDVGIGDLFVVRLAGNVVSRIGVESVQYAVDHLKTPLILVMGHQNCGAVDAVTKNQVGDIRAIAKLISPAVKKAKQSRPSNLLEKTTKFNAINTKEFLSKIPAIKQRINNNTLAIHAAYYDFTTGKVDLLD